MTSDTAGSPTLGILSLDTAFPRILGDAGNPASYPMPVRLRVVDGADGPVIVRGGRPPADLVARFRGAAQALEADGAAAIVSTCGFLVTVQADIAAAVRVPVMVSALSLLPSLTMTVGGRPIGVLTASAPSLDGALAAAGLPAQAVRVAGLDDVPAFADVFPVPKARQSDRLDRAALEAAAVAKACALMDGEPDLGAILLECGNLPPYAAAIRAATGLPVVSILDAADLLWSAVGGGA